MKNHFLMIFMLLMLLMGMGRAGTLQPPRPSNPFGVIVKDQGDLVNLDVRGRYDMPGYTLQCLMAALKAYPHAHRFWVSFSLLVFNNSMDTTILYDRRKRSVVISSSGSGDVLGSYRDHVLFTGV